MHDYTPVITVKSAISEYIYMDSEAAVHKDMQPYTLASLYSVCKMWLNSAVLALNETSGLGHK